MENALNDFYKESYKSTGPLMCHMVDLVVKVKGNELIRVSLGHTYFDGDVPYKNANDIAVEIKPNVIFDLYDLIHNDVLMNNISLDEVKNMITRIENYYTWLHKVYEPKYENTLEQFFYQVFLWVREDLYEFCTYTGTQLDIEYDHKVDENYDVISKDNSCIIIEHYK